MGEPDARRERVVELLGVALLVLVLVPLSDVGVPLDGGVSGTTGCLSV